MKPVMIALAVLALSMAAGTSSSFAEYPAKAKCQGTGTDYSNGNCQRNNKNEPTYNNSKKK
jgi:hypothetical protein